MICLFCALTLLIGSTITQFLGHFCWLLRWQWIVLLHVFYAQLLNGDGVVPSQPVVLYMGSDHPIEVAHIMPRVLRGILHHPLQYVPHDLFIQARVGLIDHVHKTIDKFLHRKPLKSHWFFARGRINVKVRPVNIVDYSVPHCPSGSRSLTSGSRGCRSGSSRNILLIFQVGQPAIYLSADRVVSPEFLKRRNILLVLWAGRRRPEATRCALSGLSDV